MRVCTQTCRYHHTYTYTYNNNCNNGNDNNNNDNNYDNDNDYDSDNDNDNRITDIRRLREIKKTRAYRRNMMTSSNGNIFHVTGPLCGEFIGPGEFPTQRPVTRSFDVFFDLRLNKRLSKQPWGWWFETLSWSLWRHCNEGAYFQRKFLRASIYYISYQIQRTISSTRPWKMCRDYLMINSYTGCPQGRALTSSPRLFSC